MAERDNFVLKCPQRRVTKDWRCHPRGIGRLRFHTSKGKSLPTSQIQNVYAFLLQGINHFNAKTWGIVGVLVNSPHRLILKNVYGEILFSPPSS